MQKADTAAQQNTWWHFTTSAPLYNLDADTEVDRWIINHMTFEALKSGQTVWHEVAIITYNFLHTVH